MEESRCRQCKRIFKLTDVVVQNDASGKLFCAGNHSPLEPDSCAIKYAEENPDSTEGNYFFIELKEYRKQQISQLAREQGFPEFVKELEGFGNFLAYTDGKSTRVYDPKTGERVHEYTPKKTSPRFHDPEELVEQHAVNLVDAPYSRRKCFRKA